MTMTIEVNLNDVANQAAVLLGVPDELLADWFARQHQWWVNHIQKLQAARPTPLTKVRIEYAKATIKLLRERQHVLVCVEHGVQGVETADWAAFDGDSGALPNKDMYLAMANRGIFDMEEAGDYETWKRPCEVCLQDELRARAGSVSVAPSVNTPVRPVTRSESAPVKPRSTSQCPECGLMMSVLAQPGERCGYCKAAERNKR
jgi:hypothetical protein